MKDDFQETIDLNVDFEKRRIYFGNFLVNSTDVDEKSSMSDIGCIESRSTSIAMRALHILEEVNKPIEFYISSYGGDVEAALGLCDMMLQTKCKIVGYGYGKVMSAATMLYAACDERYAYPNTSFMFHGMSFSLDNGKIHDQQDYIKECQRQEDLCNQLMQDCTSIPKDFWDKICKKDFYLSAQDAVKLGYVDAIVEPVDRTLWKKRKELNHDFMEELKRRV